MISVVRELDVENWNSAPSADLSEAYVAALEQGLVLYCPKLPFSLSADEVRFLDPGVIGDTAKSLAFDPSSGTLKHARDHHRELAAMMQRYADWSRRLICALLARYAAAVEVGRTSFRPVGIEGRATSLAKDDTLLHIDAFPASPVADRRILRVFSNVNPDGKMRHWRLGEPFADVAKRFYPKISRALPASAWLLKTAGLTRGYRTAYDHAMLAIHDEMKRARDYQKNAPQSDFHFPPGSTWIVFTDTVSHAALSGQYLFEQTFYVPVHAMADPTRAPLRILEMLAGKRLAESPAAEAIGR